MKSFRITCEVLLSVFLPVVFLLSTAQAQPVRGSQVAPKLECENRFKSMDANGDGMITLEEFMANCNKGFNTSTRKIQWMGKTFEVDQDGFLLKFDDWCPEWVDYVRNSEGIQEVTPDHRKVLTVLQDYYKKNGITPMVRILSKETGFTLKYIYELFPSGPGKGACKMAGLPLPAGVQ